MLWTGIALVGLWIAITEGVKARRDVRFLISHDFNGRRKIVALGHYRREVLRAVTQLLFAAAGAAAMLRPQSPEPQEAGRFMIIGLLITASTLVVVNSLLDKRDRQKLIDYWRNVDLRHVSTRDGELKPPAPPPS